MKKIILLLILLLLTGCASSNISANLDNLFSSIDNISNHSTNNILKYYSYYLPSDMGEKEVTSDSITLIYGESTIVMNLNIADIINERYYSDVKLADDGFYNETNLVYENTGTYTLKDETVKEYLYKLYDYNEYYALYLKTSDNVFYGNVAKGEVKEVTRHLLIIAKSISIESDLIVSDYSSKDIIDYQKKQLDLFNTQKPASGSLSEMLTDEATVGNQTDEPTDETTSDETNNEQVDENVDESTDEENIESETE